MMTKQDENFILSMYLQQEKKKCKELVELKEPVDIIVVDITTGEVVGMSVWKDITDTSRARNLIKRVKKEYENKNYKAIAVRSRSVCYGEIISLDEAIL